MPFKALPPIQPRIKRRTDSSCGVVRDMVGVGVKQSDVVDGAAQGLYDPGIVTTSSGRYGEWPTEQRAVMSTSNLSKTKRIDVRTSTAYQLMRKLVPADSTEALKELKALLGQ